MAKKGTAVKPTTTAAPPTVHAGRPSAMLYTRVERCGDNLESLAKLRDASVYDRCVDLIYIDPPFNSNRNYEVSRGEPKEIHAFKDRHASTAAYIDCMQAGPPVDGSTAGPRAAPHELRRPRPKRDRVDLLVAPDLI